MSVEHSKKNTNIRKNRIRISKIQKTDRENVTIGTRPYSPGPAGGKGLEGPILHGQIDLVAPVLKRRGNMSAGGAGGW